MTTLHAIELNKNNKCNNKEFSIRRNVKIIIGNATIYVPSDDTKSLQTIIKELSNAESGINK